MSLNIIKANIKKKLNYLDKKIRSNNNLRSGRRCSE